MNEIQLSEIINKSLEKDLENIATKHNLFLFHLLGPPAIGKTFLQEQLFRKWRYFNPVFLQVSGFIKNRAARLTDLLSECWDNAYDVNRLKVIYKNLLNGCVVTGPDYDHWTGKPIEGNRVLNPSSIIYIEGPMWLRCYDYRIPDFILFLFPKSLDSWEKGYLNRNINYRNYSRKDAKKGYRYIGLINEERQFRSIKETLTTKPCHNFYLAFQQKPEKGFPLLNFVIFDKEEVFSRAPYSIGEDPVYISVRNKEIAELFGGYFDKIWNSATKIDNLESLNTPRAGERRRYAS